jgi:drug/metabolite transporter (DMT)-like permease
MSTSKYSGLARIGLAGVIWGSIPIFVRMVEASPFVIVFWRVAFGAATALLYLLVSGRIREVKALRGRNALALVGVGALVAVNWVLFFGAFALTRVAVVELVGYTGPVVVAALLPFVSRERFDRRIIFPLMLAFGGTALILGLGQLSVEGGRTFWGAAMAFGTALVYAVLMLVGKRLLCRMSSLVLAFGQYSVASVLLLPAAIMLPGASSAKEWGALAGLGIFHTTTAILIFLSGLRVVRADHAAVITYAEPVTAVVFAALFLAEPLTWVTAVGGVAVIAAGILVARLAPSSGVEVGGVAAPASKGVTSEELESTATVRNTDRSRR